MYLCIQCFYYKKNDLSTGNKYTAFWLEQNKESTTKNENTQNLGMSSKNFVFSFLLWLFILLYNIK